jgi:isocitrate dehydrogenase
MNVLLQTQRLFPRFGQSIVHEQITVDDQGKMHVPNHVIIPVIDGDGIGPEITPQAKRVVEAALRLTDPNKSIEWLPLTIGQKALAAGKAVLPPEVIETIKACHVFVKAPVETPLGGGFRSVNVTLRQLFDLFQCIRPIKHLPGVVTPMKKDKLEVVLFRENTEDLYQGIEYPQGSLAAKILVVVVNTVIPLVTKLVNLFTGRQDYYVAGINANGGIGIKPITEFNSKRLVRAAIQYAIDHKRPSVTLVGKNNIMKFTEGAFINWGKEVAEQEFRNNTISAEEFKEKYGSDYQKSMADGKVVIQERITDAMMQDIILYPEMHSVIATMNLNGDIMSDLAAATAGGVGTSPGANIGNGYAMFEATHGTWPAGAGKNIANPTALILSMAMMLDYLGWSKAAEKIRQGIDKTLENGKMTGDLAKPAGVPVLSTTDYTDAVIHTMEAGLSA